MENKHLGIASVPVQQWGELYEDGMALKIGTVFKDLNKPFFAVSGDKEIPREKSENEEQQEREALLTQIMETCFILDDLTLYLDMHTTDGQAIELYMQKAQERDALKKKFAEQFYPLTRDCLLYGDKNEEFQWQDGPMPWEGACV